MSRVGNKLIPVPTDVTVTLNQGVAAVKGSKCTLSVTIPQGISFSQAGTVITVTRENDTTTLKTLHGTTRANLSNAIVGVSQGYKKEL